MSSASGSKITMPSSARSRGDRSASRPSGIGSSSSTTTRWLSALLEVVVDERDAVDGRRRGSSAHSASAIAAASP